MAKASKLFGETQGLHCELKSFKAPDKFWDKANIIARKRRISISDFIREAMDYNIKRYKQLLVRTKEL